MMLEMFMVGQGEGVFHNKEIEQKWKRQELLAKRWKER